MAVIRKKPEPTVVKDNKEQVNVANRPTLKRTTEKLILPWIGEINDGDEVVGQVIACGKIKDNSDYIKLEVMMYYNVEGRMYDFIYNCNNQSSKYLHKFANLFAEYKSTSNLYSIVGKYFIGKITNKNGYLNLVGIESIQKDVFMNILKSMAEEENEEDEDSDL